MAGKLELAFDILARDKASKVMGDVGDKADTLGGKLGGIGGIAKGAIAGGAVAGVGALGAALVGGVKDAASFEQLAAKTSAVIESTGNAANISVEGVQNLAGSLESISGVDEEEIINSQNVLATFTKIKNAGPDKVFDDAAKAALNMSTALGTDLQGASLQVGKALNDPIKGLASLGKAGVQFTAEQKEQVKAMVAAGDTAGAQKIILGELETQFGGAAEAAGSGLGGAMARLNDAIGDSFREIGTALLPILTDLAEWLAKNLPGAIEDFKAGLKIVSDFMTTKVWPVIETGIKLFQDYLLPVLKTVADFYIDTLVPAIADVIEWYWNFYTAVFDAVGRAADFIGDKVRAVVGFYNGTLLPAVQGVIDFYWDLYSAIFGAVGQAADFVADRVRAIVGFFSDLKDRISGIARTLWDPLSSTFRGVVDGIINAWNAVDFAINIKVPDWVPGIGGKGFKVNDVFPDIPTLHTGGTVTPWGIEPLRSDEIVAKLQVGETVLPRGWTGDRRIEAHFYGVDQTTSRMTLDRLAWEMAG